MADSADSLQTTLRRKLNAALTLVYQGELDQSEALAAAVHAEAMSSNLIPEACRAQRCRAQVALERGALAQADEHLADALGMARASNDQGLIAGSCYALARKQALSSQFAALEATLGNTLMHARAAHSQLYEGHAYSLLGHCRHCLGLLEDARDYWAAGRDSYAEIGNREHLLFSSLHLAAVLDLLGDAAARDSQFAVALAMDDCPNYAQDLASIYYKLAHYRGHCGDASTAQELLELGRAACAGEVDQQAQLALLIARASYRQATGDPSRALEHWQAALAFAQQRQNRYATAEVRLGMVWTLLSLGEMSKAYAVLQDAEVAFELFDAKLKLARCNCAWAAYHHATESPTAAVAAYASAKARAAELQAQGLMLQHDLAHVAHLLA